MMFSSATNSAVPRRAQHQRPAGKALSEVVVGVALEPQHHASRHEGAEALTGRTLEREIDRPVGQTVTAKASRQLRTQHRADGAIDVADRVRLAEVTRTAVEHGLRIGDQLPVERLVEAVILALRAEHRLFVLVHRGCEDRREVEALRLPVLDRPVHVEHLDVADRLLDRAKAKGGEVLAHLLGDELEEVDDELGLARELLAQFGVLGRDTDGARVEVAHAHHHAAAHDERHGREPELLGTEQRRDHHIAAGLQLAVDLHDDAVTQSVQQQRLLRLGQTQLPGRAGMLDRREPRRAGSTVVAGDQDHVGVRLRHTRRHRPDPDLGDQLHVDASPVVRVLQVVDQLLEVFDRIDVVVRRR